MAIMDAVLWNATPDVFAWRYPETNLSTWTQLVVHQSQEALLFDKGKLIAKFGPGKHVLSTDNLPILRKLYGIPYGGQNPFTAEVWFVNKVFVLDTKWGTPQPFMLRDPQYSVMVPVRANGQFGVQIADSEQFLVKLVGTLRTFDKETLSQYLKGVLLTEATSVIAKKITEDKTSVLDIAAQIAALSESLKEKLQGEFAKYGIELLNFYINSISVPDDDKAVVHLRSLLSKRAEMDILGYTYQQERSFDVLGDAAGNQGTAGGVMGAGMGLGMGFGVGGAISPMFQNMAQNIRNTVACPTCKNMIDPDARFCPLCGGPAAATPTAATAPTTVTCNKCSKEMPRNSKFCPSCGDPYKPCPQCNADLAAEVAECTYCGEKLPVPCPGCQNPVAAGANFCPVCGVTLKKKCPKCGTEASHDSAFCNKCGDPLNNNNEPKL